MNEGISAQSASIWFDSLRRRWNYEHFAQRLSSRFDQVPDVLQEGWTLLRRSSFESGQEQKYDSTWTMGSHDCGRSGIEAHMHSTNRVKFTEQTWFSNWTIGFTHSHVLLPDPRIQNFMMILIIANSIVLGIQAGIYTNWSWPRTAQRNCLTWFIFLFITF